jgi:hypothetical protein
VATFSQRIERSVLNTGSRGLRLTLAFKKLFGRRGRCLFITSFPKSGSTYLVSALARASGTLNYFLGDDPLNAQDLYLPKLVDSYAINVTCQQHTRATAPNLALMREFAIRPVVLVRDLGDAMVSLRDHLERESRQTPVITVGDDFFSRPQTAQLDHLIDVAAPWYLDFYAGWQAAAVAGMAVHWLTYEQLMADKAAALQAILNYYGIETPPADLSAALGSADGSEGTRRNVGGSGRGAELLSPDQQARLGDLGRHYAHLDLGPIGLAANGP